MEMSELVGTMLVQSNEGSFNFTGTCTHCSFTDASGATLGLWGGGPVGADTQVEGSFMV